EDGIRDFHVTGVQTCALPIYLRRGMPAPLRPAGDGGAHVAFQFRSGLAGRRAGVDGKLDAAVLRLRRAQVERERAHEMMPVGGKIGRASGKEREKKSR